MNPTPTSTYVRPWTTSNYNNLCFYSIEVGEFEELDEPICAFIRLKVSISSSFYEQLLLVQIPNVLKRHSSHQCLFALLRPTRVIVLHKMLMQLIQGFDDPRKSDRSSSSNKIHLSLSWSAGTMITLKIKI